jgi:hypothetical protein
MVAFVPLSRDTLSALTTAPIPGPVAAFGVTPGLCDTFTLPATADEEAERTALLVAGLSSLISYGSRLVLVVDAAPTDDEGGLGECTLPALAWRDVSAIFAEPPEAVSAVAAAAAAVQGLDLDAAWDAEAVQTLMGEHDLLWYGPEEVDALLGA